MRQFCYNVEYCPRPLEYFQQDFALLDCPRLLEYQQDFALLDCPQLLEYFQQDFALLDIPGC
jgi:hypothetical protein